MTARMSLFPLLILLAGCASRQHMVVTIPHEVMVPTVSTITGPAGKSGVKVHCTAQDTVFEKDGFAITFVGKRGYHGTIGERCGRVIVGDVELTYDRSDFSFAGPLARGSYERVAAGFAIEVDQSGASRVR